MKFVFKVLYVAAFTAAIFLTSTLSGNGDESAGKTQQLFNGRDLDGWNIKCKPNDRDKDFWSVKDGYIEANSLDESDHDYVWLMTEDTYSDFELFLRFQAFEDSPGNSGVQIRSRYDDTAGWLDGPQIDIHPPGPWRTGMVWDETRGNQRWLYPKVDPGEWVDPSMADPNLEFFYSDETPSWNELRIIAEDTHIIALLNGVKVTDYNGDGVLDDDTHRTRNVGLKGHIALQIHTGDRLKIRFKDIRIRRIDSGFN
ncbi:MAG: DUF1080 domain-containing protein [Verrucomicrobia bacterium]|nr:DUF1080 domain-containing protein [Verrucomicrobiota bacterium]